MKREIVLVALAACGTDRAAPSDASLACTAAFSGNFSDHATVAPCAQLTDGTLALTVPSQLLTTPLAASFTLGGAPSPGDFVPETVTAWGARADQRLGNGICVYSAGSDVVPHGSFTLHLDSLAPPHGTLQLVQYVLVYPATECGQGDTEDVAVAF